MTDVTPPASRGELVNQYRAALGRGDWVAMVAARQDMAARDEYDVAMGIRQARRVLELATTRVTASGSELSSAQGALADARERAPEAAERALQVTNPRIMAQTASAARQAASAIPALELVVAAAEARYEDSTRAVSDAQEKLDQRLAAAYARVQ